LWENAHGNAQKEIETLDNKKEKEQQGLNKMVEELSLDVAL
jgi:hypothetical protein